MHIDSVNDTMNVVLSMIFQHDSFNDNMNMIESIILCK